jgi:chromosome segregation ATPase
VTREWSDPFEIAERDREIAATREPLAQLESEKSKLEARLNRLLSAREAMDGSPAYQGAVEVPLWQEFKPSANCIRRCPSSG